MSLIMLVASALAGPAIGLFAPLILLFWLVVGVGCLVGGQRFWHGFIGFVKEFE